MEAGQAGKLRNIHSTFDNDYVSEGTRDIRHRIEIIYFRSDLLQHLNLAEHTQMRLRLCRRIWMIGKYFI